MRCLDDSNQENRIRIIKRWRRAVLTLISVLVLAHPALSEIYSYIDSQGRLTYTSDPASLPDGHEAKAKSQSPREGIRQRAEQQISPTIRIEHLNQRLELTKIEFDTKFETLSDTPALEYNQATQDILSLKFEIVDLY